MMIIIVYNNLIFRDISTANLFSKPQLTTTKRKQSFVNSKELIES